MIAVIISVLLYCLSFVFKEKAHLYVSHQNSYVICVTVATVFLLFGLYGIITAFGGRALFCIRLKRMAIKKGYDYEGKRSPFLSFIKCCKGEDIVLTRRNRVIRLKFFPYLMARRHVHIYDGKRASFSKKIAFLGGYIRPRAPGHVYSGPKNWLIWNSLFRYNRSIDLEFTKESSDNIVIIPTKCCEMTFVEGNSQRVVGSGQTFEGMRLYYQKDLLNYFDRT